MKKNIRLTEYLRYITQQSKLIAERPEFKQELIRLRQKWQIPLSGMSKPNEFTAWESANHKKIREFESDIYSFYLPIHYLKK